MILNIHYSPDNIAHFTLINKSKTVLDKSFSTIFFTGRYRLSESLAIPAEKFPGTERKNCIIQLLMTETINPETMRATPIYLGRVPFSFRITIPANKPTSRPS